MPRPNDLPDFVRPPLDEVVLGVQFSPIPGYTTVEAGAVWEIFRHEFPRVEEQPQLAPQFETFGGFGSQGGVQFHFGPPIVPSRLWFVSDEGNHLLQFQPDRFLSNWRKNGTIVPYPRYELIAQRFDGHLRRLRDHIAGRFGYVLDINQVELSYINIIPVTDFSEHTNWLKLGVPKGVQTEMFNLNFSEIIRDRGGKPIARLHHDLQSVITVDGKGKAFRLNLTFRGKPTGPGIDGAMEFLSKGRNSIVNRFAELTTKQAHTAWERTS